MRRLLLLASLLLSSTAAATAAGCLDEAERMAARYKLAFLAPTPPRTDAPATASGGAPPATADARGPLAAPDTRIEPGATAPPAGAAPRTGTAPDGTAPKAAPSTALDGAPAPPQIGSGSSTPAAEPPPIGPSERARMEEKLSQARAAELAGRSDECFRQLREAQTIASGSR
jgi:hypothetical protein